MNHIGLFEGIGGFSHAAKWMGWKTIAWCEINPFGQQVLKHHYPEATGHGDIKTTDFSIYRGQCDILTGGFPCQPFSTAGKRKGTEDDRHLWPEMLRAIREIQPKWVVGENVSGLVNWSDGMVFEQVQTDLEAEGYEILPFILPAAGVGAPHRRDRVWFVANTGGSGGLQHGGASADFDRNNQGAECGRDNEQDGVVRSVAESENATYPCSHGCKRTGTTTCINDQGLREGMAKGYEPDTLCGDRNVANAGGERLQGRLRKEQSESTAFQSSTQNSPDSSRAWDNFPTQPPVRSRDDGIPSGLSGITVSKHRNESLKAFGNAIVPQVALQIFKAIQACSI